MGVINLIDDLYCSNCGNNNESEFEYKDNYGGRRHYQCKECGKEIVVVDEG